MGCLSGIAKYILFLFNMLILIAAIAIIAVGALYRNKNPGLDIMSVSSYSIAVGVIIALISFFGCYGAVKESRCLLTTYASIMITIFVMQVVLIILAFLAIRNSDFELDNEVQKYLRKMYVKIAGNKDTDTIDALQKQFECCGMEGNYTLVTIDSTKELLIDSCCKREFKGKCTKNEAYKADCALELRKFIESNAKTIGGIAIGGAVVEVVAAIFAFWVRSNIGNHYA